VLFPPSRPEKGFFGSKRVKAKERDRVWGSLDQRPTKGKILRQKWTLRVRKARTDVSVRTGVGGLGGDSSKEKDP